MPCKTPFRRHRFPRDIVLCAVRRYLRGPLSFQDVGDLLTERGVIVDLSSICRWVQKVGPALTNTCAERVPTGMCPLGRLRCNRLPDTGRDLHPYMAR